MNYEEIRRVVEEEVLKALSSPRSTTRIRRAVISESMIVAAWRRGSRALDVAPGALVTPAARDRAASLGVAVHEVRAVPRQPQVVQAVIESVMAQVIGVLDDRPRAPRSDTPSPDKARRLVTAQDIELARFRGKTLTVGKKTRITPLAADLAETYGIKILHV